MKGVKAQGKWTKEETDILTEHYAKLPMQALMERLPGRTKQAIYAKAFALDLGREVQSIFSKAALICPKCGGPKRKESIQCYKCYRASGINPRPKEVCRVSEAKTIRYRQWEKQVLAELGPRVTMVELMMLLPRRSGVEIREMARQFGIQLLADDED